MYAVANTPALASGAASSSPRWQMILHNLQMQRKVFYMESWVADGPRHCETWTATVILLDGPGGNVLNTFIARANTRQAAREAASAQALAYLGFSVY